MLLGVRENDIRVIRSVGVKKGLVESVDDHSRRGRLNLDEGVNHSVGLDRDVDVAMREGLEGLVGRFGLESNSTEELTARPSDTEEEQGGRGGDRGVDSVLDRGELVQPV